MIHWPEEAIDEHPAEWETAVSHHDLPERTTPVTGDDLTETLKRMRRLAAHNYPSREDVKNEQ